MELARVRRRSPGGRAPHHRVDRRHRRSRAGLPAVGVLAVLLGLIGPGIGAAQDSFGRVGALTLADGQDHAVASVMAPDGAFMYVATFTAPGQIVKIDLDTFAAVDTLTLDETESHARSGAFIDPDGTHAYFATTFGASQGRLVRIELDTFTRLDHLDLDVGWVDAAVIEPTGDYAYLGRDTNDEDAIDKVDLATFEVVDTLALPTGFVAPGAAIDPDGRYAVFAQSGFPSHLHRIDLADFSLDRSLSYAAGQPGLQPRSVVIAPDGGVVYVGTDTSPANVLEVDLGSFSLEGVLELPLGDIRLAAAVITPDGRSAFFGQGQQFPGEVVRIDLDSFQRAGASTFAAGEDEVRTAVIAPDGQHAYFGTATQPARVVKVALAGGEPDGADRISGANRFETAAEIALERFDPDEVDVVYLATGLDFPDALAGGPLAAVEGAPILLTLPDVLPDDSRAALAVLRPGRVVALGGTSVVSDSVLRAAAAAAGGAQTGRLAGTDRFATAAAIAAAMPPTGTAFLATGTNFPDALAGGAATAGAPILLAVPTVLPEATRAALADLRPGRVIALGGPSAVSDAVLGQAAEAAGGAQTSRLSGPDRFATAVAIAGRLDDPDTVYVATGIAFPDALAGGPAAVAEGAPILLVSHDQIPEVVRDYLEGLPRLRRIVLLGGTSAVSDQVEAELRSFVD